MKKLLLLLLIGSSTLFAQVVSEPATSSVYDFLNRLSIKGLITFNDELRPLSRDLIAGKLIELQSKVSELNSMEKKELSYYEKDFYIEIKNRTGHFTNPEEHLFDYKNKGGFHAFTYADSSFSINADLILGYTKASMYGSSYSHFRNGAQFYGYWTKHLGFSFYYRDNTIDGNTIDQKRILTPETGVVLTQSSLNSINYDRIRGSVTYSWNGGDVSIAKDKMEWGSGVSGQIILSDKAPSFPYIKLELQPVSWLKFVYFHGWLSSGIIDSSTIRYNAVKGRNSYLPVSKYIASHILSIYPWDNFSFSLGESIIYSDRLQPVYFIPILFFRAVDHYLSDSSNTGSNAQIFGNLVYKYAPLRLKFYSSLYIDELTFSGFLNGNNRSDIGYTVGLQSVDPVISNSLFTIEYTKISPFNYMNSNDAQHYSNHGYQLGHWIGSNGDEIYLSYTQNILRGLSVSLSGDHVRKGQIELPAQQYESPYPSTLYGPRLSITDIGLNINYEIMNNVFAKVYYQHTNASGNNEGRLPDFEMGSHNSFGISIGYGM
ncbi:MAG: capsule assembly Wzi family protein [Ignavibacteriaceae bacterium]